MKTTTTNSRLLASVGAVLSVLAGASSASAIPAFPGAEGFGAIATGGRGGQVIKVTTLAENGPGSFQDALDTPGPRIIVFDVSGVIPGDHTIPYGDVTIAGQTAPGGGITIAGRLYAEYDDSVENMIVRFVRVRPQYDGSAGEQFDGIQFSLNSKVIFDHVSVSWGVDETVDLYEADDVTFQWSTIEEAATQGHPEGQHNYGMINGPDGHHISVHHNLFVHNKNRNPAIANGPADVRNNVMYDVQNGFVHHNPATGHFNIVGNMFIAGPSASLFPFYFDDDAGQDLKYWMADNYIDDPGDYVGSVDNPWEQPYKHSSFDSIGRPESYRSNAEFDFGSEVPGYAHVTTQSSTDALELVIEKSGAFPRDVVTKRMFDEMAARGGSWGVHMPDDLMEGLAPGAPPADADGDGMPDAWENAHGLDPQSDDSDTVMPSGYTAIEDYINGVADDLVGNPPPPDPGGTTSSAATGSGSGTGAGSGGGSGDGATTGSGSGAGGGAATGSGIAVGSGGANGNGSAVGSGGAGQNGDGPKSGGDTGEESSCAMGHGSDSSASLALAMIGLGLVAARRRRR